MEQIFTELRTGIFDYTDGFRRIIDMKLWSYFIAPAIIAFLFLAITLTSAFVFSDNLVAGLVALYPFELGLSIVSAIATTLGFLATAGIAIVILKNVTIALSSPFMSMLSEKIESEINPAYKSHPFSVSRFTHDLNRGIRLGARNLVRELGFTVLLLIAGLIPFLSPVVIVLLFLVQAYYVGVGSFDFTLERHGNVKQTIAFAKENRWYAIGNGALFLLLMYTGIGFLVALPLSTAASTNYVFDRVSSKKV